MRRLAFVLLAALLAAGTVAAKKKPREPRPPKQAPTAPVADSATVALWSFDENGGPVVGDSGPFRLRGTAGPDTRTDFGRFRSARVFTRTLQSFVYVPRNPALDVTGGFTVEAWFQPASWSNYEMSVIAARWSPVPGEQSWVLGVAGLKQSPPVAGLAPAVFVQAMAVVPTGRVTFVMQPAEAAAPVAYWSATAIRLDHWVHVAATVDGTVVRIWLDGRLDAQYATTSTVRASDAPLVVGDYLDERRLSDLSGQLELDENAPDYSAYYGFDGAIDELRLSDTARLRFESLDTR